MKKIFACVKMEQESVTRTRKKKTKDKEEKDERVQTVYIIRHALKAKIKKPHHHKHAKEDEASSDNKEATSINPHDNPLTPKGKKQCKELSKALDGSGIERIFCSPFTRCAHTAYYVAKALGNIPIFVDSGLCEWTPGVSPQIVSLEKLHEKFPLIDIKYESLVTVDSAESLLDVHTRCKEFLRKAEKKGYLNGTTLFVGHAASVIALTRAFVHDDSLSFYPAMCAITKLERRLSKAEEEKKAGTKKKTKQNKGEAHANESEKKEQKEKKEKKERKSTEGETITTDSENHHKKEKKGSKKEKKAKEEATEHSEGSDKENKKEKKEKKEKKAKKEKHSSEEGSENEDKKEKKEKKEKKVKKEEENEEGEWKILMLANCDHLSKGEQYGWKFPILAKELNSLGAYLNEYKHAL